MVKTTSILALLVVLAGCSSRVGKGGNVPVAFRELQEVNDLLHAAAGAADKVPAKLANLERYRNRAPRSYEAVKSGDIVVLWGASLKGEEDAGKNEAPIAYEKNVPTEGGYVLLSAGTVKKMSSSEFQSALKK